MKKLCNKKIFSVTLVLFLIGVSTPSGAFDNVSSDPFSGNILYVGGSGPGNYTTIQEAIDAAENDDMVFVYDDSSPYYEQLTVDKSIILLGENEETTVIDGELTGTVINISASNVLITGFTLQKGFNGILIRSSNNTIENNIIRDNFYTEDGGMFNHQNKVSGIKIKSGSSSANDNTIRDNIIIDNYIACLFTNSNNNAFSYNNVTSIHDTSYGVFVKDNSLNTSINNNTIDLVSRLLGVEVNTGSHYTDIKDNRLMDTCGIDIIESNYNVIVNNTLDGPCSMYLRYSSYNNVSHNTLGHGQGLGFYKGSFNTVYDNQVNGDGVNGAGIFFEESDHNDIISNTVHFMHSGIKLLNVSDTHLYNNTVDNNSIVGVYLHESDNCTISGTEIHRNDMGIYAGGPYDVWTKNNRFSNNNISESDIAVELVGAQHTIIDNNTFYENNHAIKNRWYSSYNTIKDNTFGNHSDYGITIKKSTDMEITGNSFTRNGITFITSSAIEEPITWNSHTIENNDVNGKPIYYYSQENNIDVPTDAAQIICASCSNINIGNLDIENADSGIQLGFCTDVSITNTTISDIGHNGLYDYRSSGTRIQQSTIENNEVGISTVNSDNLTIRDNNVRNNRQTGISIRLKTKDCILFNNTIENNGENGILNELAADNNSYSKNYISGHEFGIMISGSCYNIFSQNIIQENEHGIICIEVTPLIPCFDNHFYHNNFYSNKHNAYDGCWASGLNIWDNGYLSGGNYWYDYNGTDGDGNGMGDTVYVIPGGPNRDRFPLMDPWKYKNNPPYNPSDPDPEDGETNVPIISELSWTGGDPDDNDFVTYDIYFGTESDPPLLVPDHPIETYNPETLEYNTEYFWKIVVRDLVGETNDESTIWSFTTEKGEQEPQLEIGEITGGLGITAEILNIGDVDVENVEWTISLENGFILFLPKEGSISGTIDSLLLQETEIVGTNVFGLGKFDITVEAKADGVSPVPKTVTAFIIGPFVILQ